MCVILIEKNDMSTHKTVYGSLSIGGGGGPMSCKGSGDLSREY